jgi:hypothetical protein
MIPDVHLSFQAPIFPGFQGLPRFSGFATNLWVSGFTVIGAETSLDNAMTPLEADACDHEIKFVFRPPILLVFQLLRSLLAGLLCFCHRSPPMVGV